MIRMAALAGLALTTLLVHLGVGLSLAQSIWNQDARNFILNIHNQRRRDEGGCRINKLIYDQELENQAKQWADKCLLQNEMKEGRGENVAWDTSRKSEKELLKRSTDKWISEKENYDYGQESCLFSDSCHYTQMVWATSQRIGCYSRRCNSREDSSTSTWFLVCFYSPTGNLEGQPPYQKECESPCGPGQSLDNGLCVSDRPVLEVREKPLTDDDKVRDESTTSGQIKDGNEVKDTIKSQDRSEVTQTVKDEGKAGQKGDNRDCTDEHPKCAQWSLLNECQKSASFMLHNCKKSCGLCEVMRTCANDHKECEAWAKQEDCVKNPRYMLVICRKACGNC